MFRPQRRRPLAVWIAILAILANALAPSISHALAARSAQSAWVGEVCATDRSGAALALLAAAAAGDEDRESSAHSMAGACPYCAPHAGDAGLPPSATAVLRGAPLRQRLPSLFLSSPRPLFAWAATRSRGPPAFS